MNHGLSSQAIDTYKTEPYVVAADVYAKAPHTGRGGWTWYTGSASWLYRLMLESLLGLNRRGNTLSFTPCIPETWPSYSMSYRFGETTYQISVVQTLFDDTKTQANITIALDEVKQSDTLVTLIDDHQEHRIEVNIYRLRNGLKSIPQ